ncbi:hypothetical protein GQ55_9G110600 [Panicum hallii var. hallii]|uniref:Uncharacterized protein n=1 Tax=Panicum hallii var. hallii TaxID=1504633 RepID=A0A2T7C204_9POAL|nr:hypothetical protein GQ55_9G110600 [Panicum hallii var. hallii]
MKPACPVYVASPLLFLLAACCCGLLFQAAECGRPPSSPREPWKSPAAVRRDGAEEAPPHQRAAGTRGTTTRRAVEVVGADVGVGRQTGGGAARATPSSSGATPARGKPGPRRRMSGELRPPALKLARRILAAAAVEAGPGAGTDGAAASCHSYSEHTRPCPPSKR